METDRGNQSVKRVAIAILQYLRDHPLAKDNVKGIAQWWIGEDQSIVEGALNLLLQRGVVEKRGQLYKLAHSSATKQSRVKIQGLLQKLGRNQ